MLTVTLGTISYPFNRVIDWLQVLLNSELITEQVFIQYGVTDVSRIVDHPLVEAKSIVDFNELVDRAVNSRLVISHAGQGSTLMLLAQEARFVILPRLPKYKEHVDQHQLMFAKSMEQFGIKYCLELKELQHAISFPPKPYGKVPLDGPRLSDHLSRVYPGKVSH